MKTYRTLPLLVLVAMACRTPPAQPIRPANGPNERAIVSALMRANEGEVTLARLVQGRSSSAAVQQFATMMISEHTRANEHVAAVARSGGIREREGTLDAQLRTATSAMAKSLENRSGAEFDRTYMQGQVDQHQWLLETIETSMLPSTTDPGLRALLEEMRGSVQMHLERAKQILATL